MCTKRFGDKLLSSHSNEFYSLDTSFVAHTNTLISFQINLKTRCGEVQLILILLGHNCFISLLQMAGIAGANELNDRQRFRGFYRTDASSEFVGAALAEMARRFKWTQMAIISQSESLFLMVCEHFAYKFPPLYLATFYFL